MSDSRPFTWLAEVNPAVNSKGIRPNDNVSFVPMEDVTTDGQWTNGRVRTYSSVRNGFTAFQEGDVLFAKITPCMENGKGCHATNLVNGVGFGSTEFHVLRAKPGNDCRFIYHWSRSEELRQVAQQFMIGSAGQQRVQAYFFDKFHVLDIPSDQQGRIAGILDVVDEAILQTETLIAKLQKIKAGLLHDLLTRGIDENGELRNRELSSQQFRDGPYDTIPVDWELQSLDYVGDWHAGGTPRKSFSRFWNGSVPWLTPKDTKVFRIQETTDYLTELGAESGTRRVPAGSVFVVVRGMILAHTFPVCISSKPMAFNQDIRAVTANGTTDMLFLAYWFLAKASAMLRLTTESTHGTKRIDMSELRRFSIALPPPSEQVEITKRLVCHDDRIVAEERQLAKLNSIKHGLMHDLLTGKVRVASREAAT